MLDFEVQRCTRRCAATDRELKPGETFYSVLIPDGAQVVRKDFSADAWTGPPENAIGHWKSEIPDPAVKKLNWAPNDVMLHYFQQLEEQPDQYDLRYVLTLLMVRRRILRMEEIERTDEDHEFLVVFCPKNETEYKVLVVSPTEARAAEIQEELARLLFNNAG
ncbi:MAG: hypothetical protein KDA60_02420 [Planctomycetales bacterium]|nr:hypothetical protein [Planctomycetales bacterium]